MHEDDRMFLQACRLVIPCRTNGLPARHHSTTGTRENTRIHELCFTFFVSPCPNYASCDGVLCHGCGLNALTQQTHIVRSIVLVDRALRNRHWGLDLFTLLAKR